MNQNKVELDPAVAEVLKKQSETLFSAKEAKQLNNDFLDKNSSSMQAVLEGAKMVYFLDPKNQKTALNLICSLDNKFKDVNIEVSYINFVMFVVCNQINVSVLCFRIV